MVGRIFAGLAAALLALIAIPAFADTPSAQPVQPARIDGVKVGDRDRLVLSVEFGKPNLLSKTTLTDDPSSYTPQLDNRVETVGQLHGAHFTAEPGTLVVSFRNLGVRGSVLYVENGFDHPILYDALILSNGPNGPRQERTTICPVSAGKVGVEAWPGNVQGVIIGNVRTPPPGDMHCTGGTGLINDAGLPPANVCSGGKFSDPISIRLSVDPATGERRSGAASWTLHDLTAGDRAPWLVLNFPMQVDEVGGRPDGLSVLALIGLQPLPSSEKAEIVLFADGSEIARRPWQLYAQQRPLLATLPAEKRPVMFIGAIPFPLRDEHSALQPALGDLFKRIGDGKVKAMEVSILGDNGAILGHGAYTLQPAAIQDRARIAAALGLAEAAAAAPGHCAKPQSAPR